MIGRLLVLLVLMGGTFGSSSEELKGASGCADHKVLPGESKAITTFREKEGSLYLYPTEYQTKIRVTLHLNPFSGAEGHAFNLKDLCIDDLSKWYKITIRTSAKYGIVNKWAFVVSNEDCEKKFVTDYWYDFNRFDELSVGAIGGSLWRNKEPGPDCLPPRFSTTNGGGSSSFPSEFSATTTSSSLPNDPESISESSGDNGRMMKTIITISLVGCAAIIVIIVFLVFLARRRRRTPSVPQENPRENLPSTQEEPIYANTALMAPLNTSSQQEEPVQENVHLEDLSSLRGRGSAHESVNSIYGFVFPQDTIPGDRL